MTRVLVLACLFAVAVSTSSAASSPAPARIAAKITTGAKPCSSGAAPDGLWVSNYADSTIVRIDPATNRVVHRLRAEQRKRDGVAHRPLTNRVVQTLRVGGGPFPSTSAFGDVWVPDFRGDSVFRIDVP